MVLLFEHCGRKKWSLSSAPFPAPHLRSARDPAKMIRGVPQIQIPGVGRLMLGGGEGSGRYMASSMNFQLICNAVVIENLS